MGKQWGKEREVTVGHDVVEEIGNGPEESERQLGHVVEMNE